MPARLFLLPQHTKRTLPLITPKTKSLNKPVTISKTEKKAPSPLKLPRHVEADPRHEAIEKALRDKQLPLWEKGILHVARVEFSPALENALLGAFRARQLERGLEKIEKVLDQEKKGLEALSKKQGTAPAQRVSRILLVANDGAERFNRACESTTLRHSDRVLCVVVEAPAARLGEKLFGPEKGVKAVLVSDREAVTHVLFSLA